MKYQKKRLHERMWHKFVIRSLPNEQILIALKELSGPVMHTNQGEYVLVMISDMEDRIKFKLMAEIEEEEDRGYGIWGGKKYHSAATNRF